MQSASVINRIKGTIDSLPSSEQKIGKVILECPEWVVNTSIHALAKKANASGAAVVRFCKSLNFASFPELKRQLSIELSKPSKAGYFDIEPADSFSSIKEKLVANIIQTANDTAGLLDESTFLKACQLLGQAEIIYAFGAGASWLVAEDFAQKWLRSGKAVFVSQDPHVLAMTFAATTKQAIFLSISNSGSTTAAIYLAHQAKENGLTVISLTRLGQNKLKNIADLALETSRAPETELRSTATSSRFAQLLTIDVLFYYYATLHYDEMIDFITKSRAATNRFRDK